jgi:hypothetical protein
MLRQGLSLPDLASHFRLYNYFKKSGAAEEKIESFIDMVHPTDISPEKVIELVNQTMLQHGLTKAQLLIKYEQTVQSNHVLLI